MRIPNSMIRLGTVISLAAILFLPPLLAGGQDMDALKKDPKEIDFNDVFTSDAADPDSGYGSPLKIAVSAMISPKYTYKYYVELLNLIGEQLGRDVVFVQKKTYAEVNEMLEHEDLDMAFVCSGPYVSGKEDFGMEIIAVPVCHGKTVYYSYFIVSRESGIGSFDGLRGKTFAFTDPLSNTGYLVPTYYLAKRNETADSFFKETFFTHSHDNSIRAVADGLADGAAVDSLIFDFMQGRDPELTEKTIVLEKSPPYGIPPIVAPPSMTREEKNTLKEIFLSIHEDPKGKVILGNLQIDRFVEGNDEDYKTVRELEYFLRSKQQ